MTIYTVSLRDYCSQGDHLVRGFKTPEARLAWCQKVYRWIRESQNRDYVPVESESQYGDYKLSKVEVL